MADPVIVPPVPWLKWPPDKKIWAGGAAGIVAWIILSVLAHLGVDPQPLVDSLTTTLGAPHLDLQASLAGLIALLVAHYTTPSMQDVVAHVNNAVVKIANADPTNPTTAVVVPEATSDAAAKTDAKAGALPPETVKKLVDTGALSPNEAGGKVL